MTGPPPLDPSFYDAELRHLNVHFRAAADVRRADHVLDVGCGGGETTREAARAAVDGSATGVDTSPPMLEHATRITETEGLRNVTFELGDAQTLPFRAAHFDRCISRFGSMFFSDPVAAFTNIGRSLRAGGRLVLLVWQAPERNEWFTAPRQALQGPTPLAPSADGLGAFSLADPAETERILTSAGFLDVGFTGVHEPVHYGATCDAAYDIVTRLRYAADYLAGLDAAAADEARDRLRAMLRDRESPDGVHFDSAAWIVTARRQ